jgi:osmotically-inducible protein OsmY
MSIPISRRVAIQCTLLGLVTFGPVGFTGLAGAQAVNAPVADRSTAATSPTAQSADPIANERLRIRVEAALHSDPYFYDEHVAVSIEGGAVVLHGFVSSEWDLRDAIRIASKAAEGKRVVDKLSIALGGGR